MNFRGFVTLPFFSPGYTLPITEGGFSFDIYGLSPFTARMHGASTSAYPTAIEAYLPAVGYYSKVQNGTLPGVGSTFVPSTYANGFMITPIGGLSGPSGTLAYSPLNPASGALQTTFQKLTQPVIPAQTLANPYGPGMFAPPVGELNPERKYGTWSLTFFAGTFPSPGSNTNTVLLVEYGGITFKGWGIQHGGDSVPDQWGPIAWLAGVTPINNGYFNAALGVSQNYMYFPKNPTRLVGCLVTYKLFQNTPPPDYGWREGYFTTPIFDDPVLQAAYAANDFAELSVTRNGWTALLRADDYAFPGSKWVLLFMDYGMNDYFILKVDPYDPNAKAMLSQSVQRPSFKIDPAGIGWLLAGDSTGKISTTFSADLAYAPTILPIPPSTFALPCFDPCNPDLWVSQIQGALFKPPITGA